MGISYNPISLINSLSYAIENRKNIVKAYCNGLANIPGIRLPKYNASVKYNYSYFPIFINENEFGITRDNLYEKLKESNIYGRRYFYPLISNMPSYRGLESSNPDNLPVASLVADSVLCLPIYADLSEDDVQRVIVAIRSAL